MLFGVPDQGGDTNGGRKNENDIGHRMYGVEGDGERRRRYERNTDGETDKEEESKEKRSKAVHPSQVASLREVLSHPK
jgi:hypothetical protein